jgi:hypothetical protein
MESLVCQVLLTHIAATKFSLSGIRIPMPHPAMLTDLDLLDDHLLDTGPHSRSAMRAHQHVAYSAMRTGPQRTASGD